MGSSAYERRHAELVLKRAKSWVPVLSCSCLPRQRSKTVLSPATYESRLACLQNHTKLSRQSIGNPRNTVMQCDLRPNHARRAVFHSIATVCPDLRVCT